MVSSLHVQHLQNGGYITLEMKLGIHNLKDLENKFQFFLLPIPSFIHPSIPPSILPSFPVL